MGDSAVSFTEVHADNIHCCPLIYQANQFFREVYQVGQAWLPLIEAMLNTLDEFFVSNVPGNASIIFPGVEVRLTKL